ncbi:hypothetical protein pdam_00019576, partial [Pocillopora damicornis]
DLSSNKLTRIHKDTVEGLTDHLNNFFLADNKLTSVPDLTGPKTLGSLRLQGNRITDLSRIATSGIGQVFELVLTFNNITHINKRTFSGLSSLTTLDLSSNELTYIHRGTVEGLTDKLNNLRLQENEITDLSRIATSGIEHVYDLVLTFNNITHINKRTFSGLASLTTLLLIRNNLTFIAKDVFYETPRLKSLFLHSNAITYIEKKTFDRLDLKQLTIFDNPLNSLPDGMFDEMANHTK